jgi:hypothetical protein
MRVYNVTHSKEERHMKMIALAGLVLGFSLAPNVAPAQGLDPMWSGQTGMSTMNNQVTREMMNRHNKQNQRRSKATRASVACSPDSMPAAQRRQLNARAAQIMQRQGKAAAVAYARKQGMAYRKKLQAQGICP